MLFCGKFILTEEFGIQTLVLKNCSKATFVLSVLGIFRTTRNRLGGSRLRNRKVGRRMRRERAQKKFVFSSLPGSSYRKCFAATDAASSIIRRVLEKKEVVERYLSPLFLSRRALTCPGDDAFQHLSHLIPPRTHPIRLRPRTEQKAQIF